jgi:hypothetical protein
MERVKDREVKRAGKRGREVERMRERKREGKRESSVNKPGKEGKKIFVPKTFYDGIN